MMHKKDYFLRNPQIPFLVQNSNRYELSGKELSMSIIGIFNLWMRTALNLFVDLRWGKHGRDLLDKLLKMNSITGYLSTLKNT